jgi:uncharacterized repeat protein (TIGR01451 family)
MPTTDPCVVQTSGGPPPEGTNSVWTNLGYMAEALGELQGQSASQAASNDVVSEYTGSSAGSATPAPGAELETTTNAIPMVAGDFYDVTADFGAIDYAGGGAGCDLSDPDLTFSLLSGTTSTTVGAGLDPCTAAGNQDITVNGVNVRVAELVSNALQWTGGSTAGVELYNANGGGGGNDSAFDDPQVVNVTPQLDKSFSPASIEAGGTSTLTFTVTNTSELGAKDGWQFSDALPSGLTVAPTPDAATTCSAGTITAAAGAGTVGVTGGDLAAGATDCTVTVNVTAGAAGTYANGPTNVTETGLNPPGTATLTVTPQPAWTCSAFAYLFQDPTVTPPGTIYQVNLATGGYTTYGTTADNVNAVGYNTVDNFIYGWDSTNNELARIGSDSSVDDLGVPAGMSAPDAAAGFNVGDFNGSGDEFISNSVTGVWYEIDLDPGTASYGDAIAHGTMSTPATIASLPADWAYIDGAFYGMATTTSGPAHLVEFNPTTGTDTDLGAIANVPGADAYGAAYASPGGYLWVSDNNTGEIYRIDVAAKTGIVASAGPASGNNDGARCATAPIPTITLTKTVGGRVDASDQFTVGLNNSAGTTLTSATTSGTDTSASTTDWPVTEGSTYTLTDAMAAGSANPLSDYTSTISCTDATTGTSITPGGAAPDWTLLVTTTDNYACDITNTPTAVDLSVAKTSSPNPYVAGQPLTYTVTVKNAGPGTAVDAAVADPLPSSLQGAGFTWTCAPSTSSTCAATGSGNITDTVTIPSGGDVVYTETGTVPIGTTAQLKNTATLTPDPGQPDAGCTPTCSATNLNPASTVDLKVKKTADPDPYVPGEKLTYTVLVTNGGPQSATGATVSDPLPAALAGDGFTWTCAPSTGATCTASGSGDISDTVTIPSGGQLVYTVTGTVPPGTQGKLSNTATATPPPGFNDPSCTPTCWSTVNPPADPHVDLSATKTSSPNPYVPGYKLTYTITVTNSGPSDALGAKVDDPLPAGLAGGHFAWTCVATTDSTCAASGTGNVVDTVDVAVGGKLVYTVTGTVPTGTTGVLDNTVKVTPPSGSTDPGCTPDCTAANHNPQSDPKLSIKKVADASGGDANAITVGETITYTYVVSNVAMTHVGVSDPTLGAVTCPKSTLAVGASETCKGDKPHVVTQADVDAGKVTDTATAHGDPPLGKPYTSPGSSVTVPSAPKPAVSLVKTATVSPAADQNAAKVGDTITYSFKVTNIGNVDLTKVAVNDPTGGAVSCPVPAAPGLVPGAAETCAGDTPHVVTQADVNAGKVTDTATATGTDAAGLTSSSSDPSTATVTTAITPEQPLTSIITGHGWWGPSGPSGRLAALAGGGLLIAGIGLVGLRRRRKLATS